MSKLSVALRPVVEFDINNKQHRQWYAEFRARKSWAACPVRFNISKDATTVISMIEQQVIKFYLNKDFGKIAL